MSKQECAVILLVDKVALVSQGETRGPKGTKNLEVRDAFLVFLRQPNF